MGSVGHCVSMETSYTKLLTVLFCHERLAQSLTHTVLYGINFCTSGNSVCNVNELSFEH